MYVAVLATSATGTVELTLALDGPDAVYNLAPDPWMWELAEAVPGGETVDLPSAMTDPVTAGLLLAILQRTDHDVTGRGQIDYFAFPDGGARRQALLECGSSIHVVSCLFL